MCIGTTSERLVGVVVIVTSEREGAWRLRFFAGGAHVPCDHFWGPKAGARRSQSSRCSR
jgi:hypothetical protein